MRRPRLDDCQALIAAGATFGVVSEAEMAHAKARLAPVKVHHVEDAPADGKVVLVIELNQEELAAWESYWISS